MTSARKTAKKLAEEIMKVMGQAKALEAKADALGEEVARAEAQAVAARARAEEFREQMSKAMRDAKAAEARAVELGDEMKQVLVKAQAEAQAEAEEQARANAVKEWPSGRYECAGCGQSVLFTEPARKLPVCENCGSTSYRGHEPKVIEMKPPRAKKYSAGMYQCGDCGARIAVPLDTDTLSPCDFCGGKTLRPLG